MSRSGSTAAPRSAFLMVIATLVGLHACMAATRMAASLAVALAREGLTFRRAHGLVGALVAEAQAKLAPEAANHAEVRQLLDFLAHSERGIIR